MIEIVKTTSIEITRKGSGKSQLITKLNHLLRKVWITAGKIGVFLTNANKKELLVIVHKKWSRIRRKLPSLKVL